jgi:hypothetical protein
MPNTTVFQIGLSEKHQWQRAAAKTYVGLLASDAWLLAVGVIKPQSRIFETWLWMNACESGATDVQDVNQRGFARHSAMLAPTTVKNIAITMVIAAQPMIWIVTIARFAILAAITAFPVGSIFKTMRIYLGWRLINWGAICSE